MALDVNKATEIHESLIRERQCLRFCYHLLISLSLHTFQPLLLDKFGCSIKEELSFSELILISLQTLRLYPDEMVEILEKFIRDAFQVHELESQATMEEFEIFIVSCLRIHLLCFLSPFIE